LPLVKLNHAADVGRQYVDQFHFALRTERGYSDLVTPAVAATDRWASSKLVSLFIIEHYLRPLI
jgi:hypothetical protein